jgi:tetratricopeptide (TPR) repeat protein
LGTRASGKTSLLNMIDQKCRTRDLVPVRIDLDESHATSQMAFFAKVFDALAQTAFERGAFGGLTGKTYDAYITMMYAYDTSPDKLWCPFLFPQQYARAMSLPNLTVQVSDAGLSRDLVTIRDALALPTVLLFDECNVLASHHVLLEKLRNLFMAVPGYMLVVTGTPDLFPAMDEVFSPIVRQFKKITVRGFADLNDTRECIEAPLETMDLVPRALIDSDTVADLHKLTSGRPYELRLLCHSMFKRMQQGRAKTMILDTALLEEVRRELATTPATERRRIPSLLKGLRERDLLALAVLCSANACASFDELWRVSHVLQVAPSIPREDMRQYYDHFVTDGLLEERDNTVVFPGDEFDRIYTKYLARERGVDLAFHDWDLPTLWCATFDGWARETASLKPLWRVVTSDAEAAYGQAVELLIRGSDVSEALKDAPLRVFDGLYDCALERRGSDVVTLVRVHLTIGRIHVVGWFQAPSLEDDAGKAAALAHLADVRQRLDDFDGVLDVALIPLPRLPIEEVSSWLEQQGPSILRFRWGVTHAAGVAAEHLDGRSQEALFDAQLAWRYTRDLAEPLVLLGDLANNVGYVLLANGMTTDASALIERAMRRADTGSETTVRVLLHYNFAMCEWALGRQASAIEHLGDAVRLSRPLAPRNVACLLTPVVNGEIGVFAEVKEVDLLATCSETLACIQPASGVSAVDQLDEV